MHIKRRFTRNIPSINLVDFIQADVNDDALEVHAVRNADGSWDLKSDFPLTQSANEKQD
jgi:hypothetical protein